MKIFRRRMMGMLRESNYNPKCPSTFFGFDDFPEKPGILLDDVSQTIHIMRGVRTVIGYGEVVDSFTYDEYEQLAEAGRMGAKGGKERIARNHD